MIRRSLSKQLLRARQTADKYNVSIVHDANNAVPRVRSHPFSLLEHCYWDQRSNIDSRIISRQFHSTFSAQDHPPRTDQNFISNRNNNSRHANTNTRHGGGVRKGNNNHFNNHNGDSLLSPSYISQLEKRGRDHIQNFPSTTSTGGHDAALLSPWYRTSVEIIMLMSKLWGRDRNHKSDQEQIFKVVSLANDLLAKVLMIRKNELDGVFDELKSDTSFDEPGSHDIAQRNNVTPKQRNTIRPQARHLNTEILCQTVALGWARSDPKIAADAAHYARSILELLEDICTRREQLDNMSTRRKKVSFDSNDVTPSIMLYNHVLSCYSRSLDPDAETRAKMLLERMIESRGTFSRPDTFSYNNMLNLYANKGDVSAAEALLKQMEQSNDVSCDVYSYSIAMNAFQKRFTTSGPHNRNMEDTERAEELLSRLVVKYEKSGLRDGKLRPTNVTFGTIISMYAQADRVMKIDNRDYGNRTRRWKANKIAMNVHDKTNVGWGATNAERVLDWMIGLSERERRSKKINSNVKDEGDARRGGGFNHDNQLIRPSTYNFVTVMDAWAKAGMGVVGAQHCERLLDRLVSLYDKVGYVELRPNPMCFGTVINAWAKADEEHATAEHAESLLDRMEELFLKRRSSNPKEMLRNVPYNLVIDAWSRRSGNDTAERAENILRRLVSNYELTNNRFLLPDVITYTAVMKACVKHPAGGEKALKILKEMNNQYRDGNVKARPDIQALAVAMDACAKSGLTAEAEHILNDVDDSQKSRVLFNTIMSGYKSEGRGNKAEAVLRRMTHLSENSGRGRCSPDMISYALCVEAWGNSNSEDRVSRAMALLDESIQRYQKGDNNCKPSNVTFNVTADTIANSDDREGKEATVLALFEKMEGIGCEPNLISFNILIKTCAIATGSEERKRNALRIAASAYNSLPSVGMKADSITYTGMIRATVNLMEDSADKISAITGIFQQCCDDGCLNQHILNILASRISDDNFLSITGVASTEQTPGLNRLPAEWS
eukprot:CAMPEP_0172306034 /NCGR_PEP_ID=MMETSP1058-20130122/7195_1 /TAXON_ID=83371 /ORGANISM="Detonula confervacea, Strain CCMP 353" /LENGTH=1003 /DNA_ID=CAMNT_0013017805 /DNA_START=37 /DNA_END=3045 /DNA_ORIENTATION=-